MGNLSRLSQGGRRGREEGLQQQLQSLSYAVSGRTWVKEMDRRKKWCRRSREAHTEYEEKEGKRQSRWRNCQKKQGSREGARDRRHKLGERSRINML